MAVLGYCDYEWAGTLEHPPIRFHVPIYDDLPATANDGDLAVYADEDGTGQVGWFDGKWRTYAWTGKYRDVASREAEQGRT